MTSSASIARRSAESSAPLADVARRSSSLARPVRAAVARRVQRRQPVEVGGVEGVMGRDELLVVGVAVLAEQVLDQVVAAEAHNPADLPHGDAVIALSERLPPGDDVQVVGVDECSDVT
jgi:ribosomal protein L18E